MIDKYDPQAIEPKWQEQWERDGIYQAGPPDEREKFYVLEFFPYPSGDGLSVGHVRNYANNDILARYYRMRGYNVLHPMGWDAFGLPAENQAIKLKTHPAKLIAQYAANYKRQLRLVGMSYDWTREINSSSPDYYRWTQWLFLLLYKRGMAYRSTAPANWCPSCKTVLANEEVVDGRCWRSGDLVVKRDLPQWFFRITAYADRLLDDLAEVDWPARIVTMQRNWIGRSQGAEVTFKTEAGDPITVFTTRPDTLWGATFMVLSPEHPLVAKLATDAQRPLVEAYAAQARAKSEADRADETREKTGVFTGAHAINPVNQERIPIWIADYVLMTYGTGAIMAVPAHDQRDFEFARKFELPIRVVIQPEGQALDTAAMDAAYPHEGVMVNSGAFDGTPAAEGVARVTAWLEGQGLGQGVTRYRMRDWLISRQRYWGAPIPIVYCAQCGEVPVPEDQLPVRLPEVEHYEPSETGESPLATIPEFVNTACPRCGGPARREVDTMGGFACSSWYFLRFPDPHNAERAFDPAKVAYWLPVDLYVGGAEHAVMHLLYARFWTKVMYDAGLLTFTEPFKRLRNQGMILASDGRKMSKSYGNVITPDTLAATDGVDALRAYEAFISDFTLDVAWNERGIVGVSRWLGRVWNLVLETGSATPAPATGANGAAGDVRRLERAMHQAIRDVTRDIEGFSFNTVVAALMTYTNTLYELRTGPALTTPEWQAALRTLLLLMAPVCPHMAEELWQRLGGAYSIHQQAWPAWDAAKAAEDQIELVVQVNGKVRDRVSVPAGIGEDEARAAALSAPNVQKYVEGKAIVKTIYAPGRLINIVVQ